MHHVAVLSSMMNHVQLYFLTPHTDSSAYPPPQLGGRNFGRVPGNGSCLLLVRLSQADLDFKYAMHNVPNYTLLMCSTARMMEVI